MIKKIIKYLITKYNNVLYFVILFKNTQAEIKNGELQKKNCFSCNKKFWFKIDKDQIQNKELTFVCTHCCEKLNL